MLLRINPQPMHLVLPQELSLLLQQPVMATARLVGVGLALPLNARRAVLSTTVLARLMLRKASLGRVSRRH